MNDTAKFLKEHVDLVLKCLDIQGQWEGDLLLVAPGLADTVLDAIKDSGLRWTPAILEVELSY